MYEKCHLHSLREPVFVYERANVANVSQWKDFGGFPVRRYKTEFRARIYVDWSSQLHAQLKQ